MNGQKLTSRRSFLRRTVAAAGAAVTLPTIVPASVFGARAPSNRIVMGAIGVGSQGTGDMRGFLERPQVQMVAICDVDKGHLDSAKKIVDQKYGNSDCGAYVDFRELIGRGDLDAVQLAMPDHWHAIPAIEAARAGLDIHGQKPLARSIREGRAIC
ncbi:MAG: Gfo/Idh/MocA family protein, partial [Planctomycetota bacterium]